MIKLISKLVMFTLIACFFIACSNKSELIYQNDLYNNLTINFKTDKKKDFFIHTKVYVEISNLDKQCNLKYLGHLPLIQKNMTLGLQPGQLHYLVINLAFETNSLNSSFREGFLIYPKTGKKYQLDVDYLDSLLDMRLYQINNYKRKQLKALPQEACEAYYENLRSHQ